jgi:hypothetical protein
MVNTAAWIAGISIAGAALTAQQQPAPPAPPAPATEPVTPPKADDPANKEAKPAKPESGADDLPSLDELLGTGAESAAPDETAPDAEKAQLDKLLSGEELGQAFEQAVGLMKDAAKRLTEVKDVGMSTQRIQEDALRKLDQLISSLDRQAQQQQQQQQQSGDPESQQNQPRQRQQQQQQQQSQQPANGEPQEHSGPELQEGALNPELDSARAAWGALPARIRQMLMQGSNDRFSSMYNRLTQEYYRRLAEESSAAP